MDLKTSKRVNEEMVDASRDVALSEENYVQFESQHNSANISLLIRWSHIGTT